MHTNLGLGAADAARSDRACLVEPSEYLGDAAVTDQQLSGDVTGTHAQQRQLHDTTSYTVRQRPSVHEHSAQLVHAGLACHTQCRNRKKRAQTITL